MLSKIIENIMHRRLDDFLEHDNIIYCHQLGFHANHLINHALISLTEYFKNTLDNKKFVCSIFIDLEKLLTMSTIKSF